MDPSKGRNPPRTSRKLPYQPHAASMGFPIHYPAFKRFFNGNPFLCKGDPGHTHFVHPPYAHEIRGGERLPGRNRHAIFDALNRFCVIRGLQPWYHVLVFPDTAAAFTTEVVLSRPMAQDRQIIIHVPNNRLVDGNPALQDNVRRSFGEPRNGREEFLMGSF
jgi:hypothetical protein